MLLRNESKVKHSIDIKLVFDDNTTKELELQEGNFIHVSYRRNGCLKCGLGVIRKIEPYIKKWCCGEPKITAYIVLDMSEDNNACIDKVELCDIVDVDIMYPDCSCPSLETPIKPPCDCASCPCKEPNAHPTCVTGSAVTNKGVVVHG